MVELGLDPETFGAGQAADEGEGPAHGEGDGGAGAEADGIELGEVGEGVDPGEEGVVGQEEGVAAGEEDFADFGAGLECGEKVGEGGGMGAAEKPAAGAVAAVGGAGEVDLGEDAVGETLLDAGCDGGGAIFAEGVGAEAVGEELAGVGVGSSGSERSEREA